MKIVWERDIKIRHPKPSSFSISLSPSLLCKWSAGLVLVVVMGRGLSSQPPTFRYRGSEIGILLISTAPTKPGYLNIHWGSCRWTVLFHTHRMIFFGCGHKMEIVCVCAPVHLSLCVFYVSALVCHVWVTPLATIYNWWIPHVMHFFNEQTTVSLCLCFLFFLQLQQMCGHFRARTQCSGDSSSRVCGCICFLFMSLRPKWNFRLSSDLGATMPEVLNASSSFSFSVFETISNGDP